jgi:hypothetical protein
MGLRNSKLIDILYERSNYSMDDFMDFLADAELIRVHIFRYITHYIIAI